MALTPRDRRLIVTAIVLLVAVAVAGGIIVFIHEVVVPHASQQGNLWPFEVAVLALIIGGAYGREFVGYLTLLLEALGLKEASMQQRHDRSGAYTCLVALATSAAIYVAYTQWAPHT